MLLLTVRVVGILCLILIVTQDVSSLFKMTNLHCESFNKSWVVFQECRLRAIKRDRAVFNMKADIPHPAYKIDLKIEVLKKANGYKPFPLKTTVDACAFMKKRNDPILAILYDLFKDFSNINHTCPYVGLQFLDGFYPEHAVFKLPLPNGEYVIMLTWYLHSKKVFVTNVYWAFEEKK